MSYRVCLFAYRSIPVPVGAYSNVEGARTGTGTGTMRRATRHVAGGPCWRCKGALLCRCSGDQVFSSTAVPPDWLLQDTAVQQHPSTEPGDPASLAGPALVPSSTKAAWTNAVFAVSAPAVPARTQRINRAAAHSAPFSTGPSSEFAAAQSQQSSAAAALQLRNRRPILQILVMI